MKELALDTIWALNEIRKSLNDNRLSNSLLNILPHIPIKRNDPLAAPINVPVEDLIRALRHPSGIIARGALYILFLCKRKEDLRTLLKDQDAKIIQRVEDLLD